MRENQECATLKICMCIPSSPVMQQTLGRIDLELAVIDCLSCVEL